MASNQTPNLQLCQWEADDEVLRADFNADNAKIDAAVETLAERLDAAEENRVLVTSASPEAGSTLIRLSLAGFNRSKWRRLVLYGQLYGNGTAYLYLNNNRRSESVLNCYAINPGMTDTHAMLWCVASGGHTFCRVEFDLMASLVWCQFFSCARATNVTNGSFGASMDRTYSWSSVTELTISTPSLSSGSWVKLWAER